MNSIRAYQYVTYAACRIISAVLIFLVLSSTNVANAAAPQLINYQALLKGPSGNPLDTTVDVVFTVYNHPTANNVLWTESYGGLTITDGNLSVLLGSIATLPDSLFKGTDCFLGIKVGADPEITPRNRLASVPYAFRLESVDGAKAGDLSGALSLIIDETKALGDALLVKNQAGEVLFSVKLGPLGTAEMSIFDPVDSKDGNLAVTKRVEITAEGIVMFDTTGTDTSVSLTSTGNITGTGQIVIGENATGAIGTTVFGVNNSANGDTSTVSGGADNSAPGGFATVGGGSTNSSNGDYAVISGGLTNLAAGFYSTIGGGLLNETNGTNSTVAGGSNNSSDGEGSTIGGGSLNSADGSFSVVAGGYQDSAKGTYSGVISGYLNLAGDGTVDTAAFVGGGRYNAARGKYAVVVGGGGGSLIDSNSASGDNSFIGGGKRNSTTAIGATISGGHSNTAGGLRAAVGGGEGNYAGATFSTVAGGGSDTASGDRSTIAGGELNKATASWTFVGGGVNNRASGFSSAVAGGNANTASGDYSSVGGGNLDTTKGAYAGVASGYSNLAGDGSDDTAAFVGGGYDNEVTAKFASVGGGKFDTANGLYSTIGGGRLNKIASGGTHSIIAGGYLNLCSGTTSAIGGGFRDTIEGGFSMIPGGYGNKVTGDASFAAGSNAKALHHGSFVWADLGLTGTVPFASTAENQFNVRSEGGFRLYTDSTLTSGVTMGSGASSWTSVSDKSVKKDFREINSDELLKKLSEIPISRWKYIAEQSQADHIGPMSQDFYSAFGLGDDDKRISTIDADGVALAAIQALYKENQELKKRLEKLELQLNKK